LPDVTGPAFSPLTAIRLAAPDSPTLREVAREMGVSGQLVSMFEAGRTELSDANLAKYAKAVDRTAADVRARWLQTAFSYHTARARQLREELTALGGKNRSGRPPKALKR
jgi:transcriptional regulator with XRE-family HTH domain